jgi:uncharacterized cupredoxin-like copper-binding protein
MEHRINRLLLGLLLGLSLIVGSWILLGRAVLAAPVGPGGNLAKQPAIAVMVKLGDASGALRFEPSELSFEAGRRYQLHLVNDSPTKHYFTAKDFADGIWSQKVDTGGVEIKGAIHDIEVRSQAYADWVFVPVRSGHYDLSCAVPGHRQAGMVGHLNILDAP